MMRLIYQVRNYWQLTFQMNIGWQEFLGFYTGLNTVRKTFDEKFQEQRGIGEETDDPFGSGGEDADDVDK